MFKQGIKSIPIVVLIVAALLLINYSGFSRAVDKKIYDQFILTLKKPSPDDIVIVAIDEKSIHAFGKWPWHRGVHVQLLTTLKHYNPTLVAMDILFVEKDDDPSVDRALVEATKALGNVIYPVFLSGESTHKDVIYQAYPFPKLAAAASALGHVQINPDEDGIGRSVYLKQGIQYDNGLVSWWPHFSVMAVNLFESAATQVDADRVDQPIGRSVALLKKERRFIPYIGQAGSFKTLSYSDVVLGRVGREELENKIIFVGAQAVGLGDSIATPMTKNGINLPGVEMNANVFEAVRSNALIYWMSDKWSFISVLLLIGVLATLGIRLSIKTLLLVSFLLSLAALGLNYILLHQFKLWLPIANLFIGLLFIYFLWSFFRITQAFLLLKDEVLRAESTPTLFSEPENMIDIQARLNGLLSSGKITGWKINKLDQTQVIVGGRLPSLMERAITEKGVVECNQFLCEWTVVWKDQESQMQASKRLSSGMVMKKSWYKRGLPNELITTQIEQLKDANKQVRFMYSMTRDTLSNMRSLLLVFDSLGRILYSNENAERRSMFDGITPSDRHVFGYLDCVFDPKNGLKADVNALLFDNQEVNREIESLDGQFFYVQGNKARGVLAGGAYLISLTDISEIKRLQQSREEALQFLSHDLRTPIVSMIAILDTLRDQAQGSKNQALIEQCAELADGSLNFANGYLQIVRAEDDELDYTLVDAEGIFETAIAGIYPVAQKAGVSFQRQWPKEVSWVKANVNLLNRALQNLLSNAIKYSNRSDLVEVGLLIDDAEELIGFSVKDFGFGIPEDHLPKLYERFERASNVEQLPIQGTGLGLRFVNVVAQRHFGRLDVKSVLNEGSVFILWLPNTKESVK
ncbi:MAG: CHASE2 domain-containing protein [Pseudomonadota bacterium]